MSSTELVVDDRAPPMRREEPQLPAAAHPAALLQLAVEQGADVEKLERLMSLQERWEANQARKAYARDMARFKAQAIEIKKSKHVKFKNRSGDVTDYWHALLSDIVDAINAPLAACGFTFDWDLDQDKNSVIVACVMTHTDGYQKVFRLRAPPDTTGGKNNIQAVGSVVSYLQRYTLLAAIGRAPEEADDDGRGGAPAGRPPAGAPKQQQSEDPRPPQQRQAERAKDSPPRDPLTEAQRARFCSLANDPDLAGEQRQAIGKALASDHWHKGNAWGGRQEWVGAWEKRNRRKYDGKKAPPPHPHVDMLTGRCETCGEQVLDPAEPPPDPDPHNGSETGGMPPDPPSGDGLPPLDDPGFGPPPVGNTLDRVMASAAAKHGHDVDPDTEPQMADEQAELLHKFATSSNCPAYLVESITASLQAGMTYREAQDFIAVVQNRINTDANERRKAKHAKCTHPPAGHQKGTDEVEA